MDALHLSINSSVNSNHKNPHQAASRGKLPNFTEGDFVLVSRADFHSGENFELRWSVSRRIIKALSDFVN